MIPKDCKRLAEVELAEARGERKGRSWHLAAAAYRRLGEKAAYVHQRGFEPMQQEQMVQQYVEKHGSIGRGEVAELCRLSPPPANSLLKRLEKEGEIQPTSGSSKGVRMGPRANNQTRAIENHTRVNNRTLRETRHKPNEGDTK